MFVNNPPEARLMWLSSALCLTFIVNQYSWLQSNTYISSFFIGLTVATIVALMIKTGKQSPEIIFVLLILCFLGTMMLGKPTSAWDARSIWLFHAKRIYWDNSLLAQFDDYAAFSHNDYPVLVPALSATLAKIVGHWNEIFPKVSNLFFVLPPLVVIGVFFSPLRFTFLFVIGLFFIVGRMLTNGFMDGILSLYIVSTLILLSVLFLDWRQNLNINRGILTVTTATFMAVLVGIKNEGTMAALIMFFGLVVSLAIDKKRIEITKILMVFLPAFMISVLWLMLSYQFGVGNDVATKGNFINTFTGRILDSNSLISITIALYFKKWAVLLPFVLCLIHLQHSVATNHAISFLLRFALLYSFSLFFIYLGTPHDLEWHLATSAKRTMLPFFMTLMTAVLIFFIDKPLLQKR